MINNLLFLNKIPKEEQIRILFFPQLLYILYQNFCIKSKIVGRTGEDGMKKTDRKRISPAISRTFISFICFCNAKWCKQPEFECISMLIDAIYTAIDCDFTEIACVFIRNDFDHR